MSQTAFCSRAGFALPIFGYWLGKYRKENLVEKASKNQTFIPVTVPISVVQNEETCTSSDKIEVHFPNGVRLNCPAGLDIEQFPLEKKVFFDYHHRCSQKDRQKELLKVFRGYLQTDGYVVYNLISKSKDITLFELHGSCPAQI